MSIFRVEKNTNYTVISNYHLRDKNLSLKTIGLLSLILSLPDTWDYSQAGLAAICKDGEDSIRSGLKELEKYGYLERERERDDSGRMRGIVYHIYEVPRNKRDEVKTTTFEITSVKSKDREVAPHSKQPSIKSPKRENPILDNPTLETPIIEFPILASPTYVSPTMVEECESIKDIESKEEVNKDELNTDVLNIHPSINQRNLIDDRNISTQNRLIDREVHRRELRQLILTNIGYEFFEFKHNALEQKLEDGSIGVEEYDEEILVYDLRLIDRVVDYMLDVLTSLNTDPIKVGNELISREVVRAKLMRVGIQEMKRVIYELNTNPAIKNPKRYAISMLYNA